jgi:DNA modification methylase
MNKLLFGDNLNWLRNREIFPDASVDLIYLDPPFNSKRDYAVIFKSPKGYDSEAQAEAFKDTWHWTLEAGREFDEIILQSNQDAAAMIQAFRSLLGVNDMMAYLTRMTIRLLELHRVLKPTGSLYLHCDPTASHYLKIVLDCIFGKENFRSEINWRRASAHNDAKQGRKQYGNVRDLIFFYSKSENWKWNWLYTPYDKSYLEENYRHVDEKGRRYRLDNLTAAKPGGDVSYEFHGTRPYKGRYWAYSKANMEKFLAEGRLYFPKNNGTPAYKRYLDEMPGVPLQNDWQDIPPVSGDEDSGYGTQKPLALLERIISASSNEGDLVLDPFCGCGTAVLAAQKLRRKWIGIDITSFAVAQIEDRLKKMFPENAFAEGQQRLKYIVDGLPKDFDGAKNLAAREPDGKYQFQWWAVRWLLGGQLRDGKKKGGDGGIDGVKHFTIYESKAKFDALKKPDYKKIGIIIISVKAGENVTPSMVKDLIATVSRERAEIGLFVTLAEPTSGMITEAASAGFYQMPNGKKYPRIQILTIEGLMNKTERAEHPDYEPDVNYAAAEAEANAEQKGLNL